MSTGYTAQDYIDRWFNTFDNTTGEPTIPNFDQAINSMFLYEVAGVGLARVNTFKLLNEDLKAILTANNDHPQSNQMRLHLGADPSRPYGQVTDTPAFTLVVDAYDQTGGNHEFSNLVENFKIMEAVLPPLEIEEGPSGVVPHGGISQEGANIISSAFSNDFPPLDPPSTFTAALMGMDPSNSRSQLVKGFTVGSEDVALILGHLDHGDQTDLYVHLGYYPTNYDLPHGDWFRFRCVLQIDGSAASDQGNSFYYEFSRPCPPSCGNDFVEKPFTNPFGPQ